MKGLLVRGAAFHPATVNNYSLPPEGGSFYRAYGIILFSYAKIVEKEKGGGFMTDAAKARVIQEYVPGKQVTLAHVICNPRPELCSLMGVEKSGAIGIMTITPGEGAIIAADIASKSGDVKMDFIDRFTGCVLFTGDVAAVESSLESAVRTLATVLGFAPAPLTRT